jgi:hypothetical protein
VAVALAIAGCSPGPGESIAAAVRAANLPFVDRVLVSPKNPLEGKDQEDVYVYLTDSATDDEVRQVWCNVMLPAGPDRLSPGGVILEKGFTFHPEGSVSGGQRVAVPACPAGTPSASLG